MKTIQKLLFATLFISTFYACSSDDPEPVNEEEVITTLTATLTPSGGGTTIILKSFDADGTDGPTAPIITISPQNATLDTNTTYVGEIEVLNETENPAEDITEEVLDEDEEHQFFFTSSSSIITTIYNDMDDDGNPIGVSFNLVTASAGSANLTITLLHEPDKNAAGVSGGNIANAGGEEDVVATFGLTIQ